VVPVAIALPIDATNMRQQIWIDLSSVFAELRVTHTDRRKVANYSIVLVSHKIRMTKDEGP
jgi:hypothetical protein